MPRYCIKCGREESPENPLVGNMCLECFLKYKGIVRKQPALELTICNKCGSWRYKGKWLPPQPLEEMIRRILLDTADNYLHPEVELIEVDEVTGFHRVNREYSEAIAHVTTVIGGEHVVKGSIIVRFKVNKTLCPRCFMKAGKSYSAVVQVRSSRGRLNEKEKQYIRRLLGDPGLSEDIVEIEENKNGLNIKMITPVLARKLASIISREKGAKVIETFKVRKYDPARGRKEGITTISVRLPDIEKGDIVEYKSSLAVVKDVKENKIEIVNLQSGEISRIEFNEYWSGKLHRSSKGITEKKYIVIAVDPSTIYLMDEETGEVNEYPRLVSLNNVKEGDKMKGYIVKDKLYVVKEDE